MARIKDNSSRTKLMRRWQIVGATGVLLVGFAAINIPAGVIHHNNIMAQSSTGVGQEMTFKRSDASVVLKGLYTDTEKSALVARIGVSDASKGKLPSKGSDYRVFISSDAYGKDVQQVDVLFGRLGTDGDMFLVIPKPTKDVYSVFVMNTVYLNTGTDARQQASEVTNGGQKPVEIPESEVEASITDALSAYNYNPRDPKGSSLEVSSNVTDMISWRMTTDPADDSDEYTPVVLDTTLLEGSTFNFEGMFDKLFKESAYQELSRQHDQLSEIENSLTATISEYESRLAINPNDSAALTGIADARKSAQEIQKQKKSIADQLNSYEQLTYNEDIFTNLQTKAKVIEYDD